MLFRYINAASSDAERTAVEAWLAESEANRAELTRLERAWRLAGELPQPAFDTRALWERIRSQLDDAPPPVPPYVSSGSSQPGLAAAPGATSAPGAARAVPPVRRASRLVPPSARSGRARSAVRALAAVAVLAVAVFFLRDTTRPVEEAPAPTMRSYATQAGERAEVTLTDGSTVVLSGQTTLRIPSTYGQGSRDVHLDGEAYFEVTHDTASVFRVHTSRMVAEDLGTKFVVTAWAGDSSQQVAVSEGMVAVAGSDSAPSVVLNPNDVARVSSAGVVSALRNVPVDRYFSWVEGVVHFDQDRLSEAVKTIERRFGVTVRIADSSLARRRFTGSVRVATVHDDLRAIALLLDASYERDGQTVTLSAQR